MKHSILNTLPATLRTLLASVAAAATIVAAVPAHSAATITILNADPAGVGFNDSTAAAPVGGNSGTTLGQQRLIAFQAAAAKWGATLDSSVTIVVRATWEALTCDATSAVLGSAGAATVHTNFANAPFSGTLYSAALANKLAGTDLNGATQEMTARFNINLGQPGCLTGTFFYLGLDNNHGANTDLVTVLTHEFAHGLGFQTFTSSSSGSQFNATPSVYDRFLVNVTTGKNWLQMTDAERSASAINPGQLAWNGPRVASDVPSALIGTPRLVVNAPAGLAGNYLVGVAGFGPPLNNAGVTGDLVLVNDLTGTLTDGCEALAPGSLTGVIALMDRGNCNFTIKVKNAQNAGAIAAVIADNAAGTPPPGLGGADATITIPSVRITLADGNTFKTALGSGAVNIKLYVDPTARAGVDMFEKPLMFSPNPVQSGSSVSHWDTTAFPNQLMEPSINGDLTHEVTPPADLSFSLMRDVGWVATALPSTIAKTAGDLQATPVNGSLATAPSVTISPAVAGLTVTWTVNTATAASASFPSTSSRFATSTTNASGVATAPTLTANGSVGAYSMNATVPGAGTTTFTLSNIASLLPDLTITKTHIGSFARSFSGATYVATVTNSGGAAKTAGLSVSVTDAPPSGISVIGMEGPGWTCTTLPTCTRSDALAAGASYPQISITVAVAPNATSPQDNVVNVSTAATETSTGNNSATDSTTIVTTPTNTVTVTKAGTGSGIVFSRENWISCGPVCQASYANGSVVRLTATAPGGSVFTGWLGACTGTAATCEFTVGGPVNVVATFAPSPLAARILDIDDNNAYEAAFDGVLVLRHLFGLTGSALSNGATGTGANPARVADPALRDYLSNVLPYFDIDGDGQVLATTDGLILLRKLLGFTGTTAIIGATSPTATRTAQDIDAYYLTLRP